MFNKILLIFILSTSLSLACDPDILEKRTPKSTQFRSAPWRTLSPILSKRIKKAINNNTIEEQSFCFSVHRDDFESFSQWSESFRRSLSYPKGMSRSNEGVDGERVNGVYEHYHIKLTLFNYSMREKSARTVNEYNFFGDPLNKSLLNEKTFYNLMARVGFKQSDFEEGATGLQGRILVKPVTLLSTTLPECSKELKDTVLSTLMKSHEKYITFVFNLPSKAGFTVNDISFYGKSPLGTLPRDIIILSTIYETDENRLYLCVYNDKRKTLNLHGFTKGEKSNGIWKRHALNIVRDFIKEKYDQFQSDCMVITGRGNHINSDGTRGVLLSAFLKWMQDPEIKPLVEKSVSINGGGGFRVFLKKPTVCDITKLDPKENPLQVIAEQFQRMIHEGKDRLLIKTNDTELNNKLIMHLLVNHTYEIPPFSLTQVPGELRFTFLTPDGDEQSSITLKIEVSAKSDTKQPATSRKRAGQKSAKRQRKTLEKR